MIIDIPGAAEFRAVGLELLNAAWDHGVGLLINIDEAGHYEIFEQEVTDAFWASARISLSTSLAIVQQGSEFLLKSKIAEVSPYLLLAAVNTWPKRAPAQPTAFSEFRTVDAQDLIKIHDTVRFPSLSDDFIGRFNELRRKRNIIMHSVDPNLQVGVAELLKEILAINEELGEPQGWTKIRRRHLQAAPMSQMDGDWGDMRLVWEFSIIPDLLGAEDLSKFFGVPKNQERYVCPNCAGSLARQSEIQPESAVLKPDSPSSTEVFCFVCNESSAVVRLRCSHGDCRGNVISPDWEICLTCGSSVADTRVELYPRP